MPQTYGPMPLPLSCSCLRHRESTTSFYFLCSAEPFKLEQDVSDLAVCTLSLVIRLGREEGGPHPTAGTLGRAFSPNLLAWRACL